MAGKRGTSGRAIARPEDEAALVAAVSAPAGAELSAFERLPRPWPRLCVLLCPLLVAIPMALLLPDCRALLAGITRHHGVGMIMFGANAYVFLAFWLLYFASGWNWRLAHCQSLRALLRYHSILWSGPVQENDTGDEKKRRDAARMVARREKAKTTMATQAIFIAITVFIISSVSSGDAVKGGPGVALLDYYAALLALSAAILSFTLLLISTDAAETMFNIFAPEREELAIHRLYFLSARLKYYGFVLCFLSLCLFVATLNPFIGSLAIILFLMAGYGYWYPDASESQRYHIEAWLFRIALLGMNVYILAYAI